MRKRLLYGSGIVLLLILITLVGWQGHLDFGDYAPADPGQTMVLWGVSTLIFVLMVLLGFILARTGVKLYVERRTNREGSRIRTKLVVGALALSFMPVFFMVLYSVEVMNRNIDKWFTNPVEKERRIYLDITEALSREMNDKVKAQAALLAAMPETRLQLAGATPPAGYLENFCKEHHLTAVSLHSADGVVPVASSGVMPQSEKRTSDFVVAHSPVYLAGRQIGAVTVVSHVPFDLAREQRKIEQYEEQYRTLASARHAIRQKSVLLLSLITLFILFVATWIALFLAKQISVPIAALARAAEEVGKGNLTHRVDVGANDELVGLVRGFNQMTGQLEANSRELNARRRFTEAILENIPTGVISVAADGSIQRINRALKRILPEEIVTNARRLDDLFPREDVSEIRYLMNRARRTGLASRQFELTLAGRKLNLAVTVSSLEDRVTSGFVMVIEDTGDLLRVQKAAAWNEVARRIAHEIKNPLTPIGLSAERIARQLDRTQVPPDFARIARECTGIIINEVHTVKTLVDEFSQFARFPGPQPVRSDLNEVVESALAVFAGRLENIHIRISLARNLPPVSLDREQFKRVVVNLVDNAAEAMQDSLVRQLQIVTQPGLADTVELMIADTGVGVSEEDREKLFVPYFSTKGRGTGLGLAIVNNILADHGAQIRVENNVPVGTRFTIEIPVLVEVSETVLTPA